MGTFFETIEISAIERRDDRQTLRALVDTGSEYTWVPAPVLDALGVRRERAIDFVAGDGTLLTRDLGYAMARVNGVETIGTVAFGEPDDSVLLGAHTLEGLNLLVDPLHKRLLPGGAVPGPTPRAVRAPAPV